MLKTIIGKLKRKKIMVWTLMWLNWSVIIINAMLHLLDIYIDIDIVGVRAQDCILGIGLHPRG